MSKYASLLFSPESYHEIGPFRFPVYHDLVPGEATGFEAIVKKESKHTFNSIKLAQQIAKDKDISTTDAIDLLGNPDKNQEIVYEYATQLEELQQLSIGETEKKVAKVTLVMKYRGEVKLPRSREWTQVQDWTEEDSQKVPTKILDKIIEFIEWEKDGWPEPEGKSDDETSET